MPLYEYQCAKDGRFELIRRFSDPPLKKCPTCGRPVEKLVSTSAFQFKGTGWYVTDYARKSEAKSNGTDASGKDASGKKNGETKSPDSSVSKDTSKDAKTSTPTPSISKESSASKGSSPT